MDDMVPAPDGQMNTGAANIKGTKVGRGYSRGPLGLACVGILLGKTYGESLQKRSRSNFKVFQLTINQSNLENISGEFNRNYFNN